MRTTVLSGMRGSHLLRMVWRLLLLRRLVHAVRSRWSVWWTACWQRLSLLLTHVMHGTHSRLWLTRSSHL